MSSQLHDKERVTLALTIKPEEVKHAVTFPSPLSFPPPLSRRRHCRLLLHFCFRSSMLLAHPLFLFWQIVIFGSERPSKEPLENKFMQRLLKSLQDHKVETVIAALPKDARIKVLPVSSPPPPSAPPYTFLAHSPPLLLASGISPPLPSWIVRLLLLGRE